MPSRSAEPVDVKFFEVLSAENLRISRAVFLNDVELDLRPIADLVNFKECVGHAPTCNSYCLDAKRRFAGNWFHSFPSSSLPPVFGERPPHCLKKNATRAATHWFRISMTHSGFIGRARGPLSPPTMTQSMPSRHSLPTGAISGSTERKRTLAFDFCKCAIRDVACSFSTETPNHICAGALRPL